MAYKDAAARSAAVTRWRQRTKERAIEFLGGKCRVCGYAKCPGALEFHHLDPDEKEFGFGTGHTRAWARMVEELKKCILLCANCHREVHAGLVAV
jgi:predicted HNH restriction endonuclease